MSFKYESKPHMVEAFQIPARETDTSVTTTHPQWLFQAILEGDLVQYSDGSCSIEHSTGGNTLVNPSDYLVLSPTGELSKVSNELFELMYQVKQ